MAAHLTEKENYMRTLSGGTPEYVPTMLAFQRGIGIPGLRVFPEPGVLEFSDMFGVPMIVEPNSGPIPKPGEFILEDIRKWRDIIKRPKVLDEINWEMSSKEALDNRDPEWIKIGGAGVGNGYFMMLTYFMGFNNALIAIMEEPEEVKELLNFILELNLELGRKFIEYFKPDVFHMGDDIAHERGTFVSEAVFLDIFEPMWRAQTKIYKDEGILAEHHNCGAFQSFCDHIVNMGFNAWNPAQPTYNDLPAVKRKYGNKLTICGGIESNGFVSWPETSEEEVRAEVNRVMDELAPGGGFAFGGFIMGGPDNEDAKQRNVWINEEYEKNKYKYYS
ncbi:MAG: hypothetical protein FWG30_02400 [Eubacteriaceae bacterium]|nr:hypothetical protein [Eubacteriaceae bacterium]